MATADLTISEGIAAFAANRAAILQMWAFYSTVTLGLVTSAVASDKLTRKRNEVMAILIGYALFALSNAYTVIASQVELRRMAKALEGKAAGLELAPAFVQSPLPPLAFGCFYFAISAAALVFIWIKYKGQAQAAAASS